MLLIRFLTSSKIYNHESKSRYLHIIKYHKKHYKKNKDKKKNDDK
jgi:hypothetical protein